MKPGRSRSFLTRFSNRDEHHHDHEVLPEGHGFTFTIGRGTEVVVAAIEAYRPFIVNKYISDIYESFGEFWTSLIDEEQLRWIGPEKGAVHMAVSAIVNALWDLRAKIEQKPLWKLICDMSPEELVNCLSFRHITDELTEAEALAMLQRNASGKEDREREVLEEGVPAYVTSAGWLGYDDDKIKKLATEAIGQGWTRFKMKVGVSVEDDRRRAAIIRDVIGYDNKLMMDANQIWDVSEAINWMQQMVEFKPVWIEEPTNPDDILGHKKISEALNPLGIKVATGEHCQNRVVFKQFIASGALQFAQIDACRMVEFADHLHEHMIDPVKTKNGCYIAPKIPGYSSEMTESARRMYCFPDGLHWNNDKLEERQASAAFMGMIN